MRISDWSSDVCSSDLFPDSLHAGSAWLRPDRACGLCFAQVSADGLPCNEVRIACDRIAGNLDELRKPHVIELRRAQTEVAQAVGQVGIIGIEFGQQPGRIGIRRMQPHDRKRIVLFVAGSARPVVQEAGRSEEHTSELQSLMRISYAVFCLKKKKKTRNT